MVNENRQDVCLYALEDIFVTLSHLPDMSERIKEVEEQGFWLRAKKKRGVADGE